MSAPAAIANAVADALGVERDGAAGHAAAHLGAAVKPSPLRLERPRSLEEALALLAEHGDDAKVIAGGQSLVPLLNFRLAAPARARRPRPGARARADRRRRRLPCAWARCARSATSSAMPRRSTACPLLALALPYVGHVATRNRGTVGGSIAHADAAAELPLLLQTLAGEVEVTGPAGARLVPAEEFFVSHLTSCLEAGEIVTEVRFPAGGAGLGRGLRRGCAAPRRLRRLRRRLRAARRGRRRRRGAPRRGRGVRPAAAAGGRRARRWSARAASPTRSRRPPTRPGAAVDPSDGMHASAEYRRHLTGVLVAARCRSAPMRWRPHEGARRSRSTAGPCTSTSTTGCCCPTSCATRSACAARTSAASTASAAPAPCRSTAARCARA